MAPFMSGGLRALVSTPVFSILTQAMLAKVWKTWTLLELYLLSAWRMGTSSQCVLWRPTALYQYNAGSCTSLGHQPIHCGKGRLIDDGSSRNHWDNAWIDKNVPLNDTIVHLQFQNKDIWDNVHVASELSRDKTPLCIHAWPTKGLPVQISST